MVSGLNSDIQQLLILSTIAPSPRTFRNVSFTPTNQADAGSSAVPDERTATPASDSPTTSHRWAATDRVNEPVGHVGFIHREARLISRLPKSNGVFDVKVAQEGLKTSGESGVVPERRVGWGADDETRRYRKTGPGELSEVGALGAGIRHVSCGDLAEHSNRSDLRGHGDGGRGHCPRLDTRTAAGIRVNLRNRLSRTCGWRLPIVLSILRKRWGSSASPAYPREHETEIVLRDGSTVHVRPIRADDETAIRKFLETVSEESIAFRFFGIPNIEAVIKWTLDVDYSDRYALVVESGEEHKIVAHATYIRAIRANADRAEVAFLVADGWQGKGISTILLAKLAAVAEEHGISTFVAEVLPQNNRMIQVFRDSGFPVELRSTPEAIEVELPTSLTDEALARFEEREDRAAVEAVRALLEPRSVAVVGASRRRGTIGGEVLHNLLAAEFNGPVYAVNDQCDVVQSLPAYRAIGDIPGTRRPRRDRCSCRSGRGRRPRVCCGRRTCAARDLLRIRRGRRGGSSPAGRAAPVMP